MGKNVIDGAGIAIESYPDIISDIVNGTGSVPGLITIYGADINLGSNTPDGNFINIFALSKEDILQLCVSLYDSFDPDEAVGVALDNISQLCGIARMGGSYTVTDIVVTATQAVNLSGLDDTAVTPFTISDANGNQFNLLVSQTISAYGTYTYSFQAEKVGFIQVIPNTITNIVTITPGIAAVNNPNAPTLVGADQETDAAMRVRRQVSVALPAQGAFYGLYAGLLSVYGLGEAVVYVNNTHSVDAKGVPANSIWVITDGGSAADIGDMIYRYLNLGCGMKGNQTVNLTQIDGSTFPVYYDEAVYQNFYATMRITSKSAVSINTSAIQTYLSANYVLGIHEAADITSIDTLIREYSSDLVANSLGVSLTLGSYGTSVLPSAYLNKLVLPVANITITT
jgi:uncharacterized phage protein gp47/JayE